MARTRELFGPDGSKAIGVTCCGAMFETENEAREHEDNHGGHTRWSHNWQIGIMRLDGKQIWGFGDVAAAIQRAAGRPMPFAAPFEVEAIDREAGVWLSPIPVEWARRVRKTGSLEIEVAHPSLLESDGTPARVRISIEEA